MEIDYNTIWDIRETTEDFLLYVMGGATATITWEECLANCKEHANEYTFQAGDGETVRDQIDVDYGKMCFTVEKDANGNAKLCDIATYYPDGLFDESDSEPIEIVLNKGE